MSGITILGDGTIPVNKISFSIPNLRELWGVQVKSISESSCTTSMNRIRLEDENFLITIDKCIDYKERIKSLQEKGGYLILYAGELTTKKFYFSKRYSRYFSLP